MAFSIWERISTQERQFSGTSCKRVVLYDMLVLEGAKILKDGSLPIHDHIGFVVMSLSVGGGGC